MKQQVLKSIVLQGRNIMRLVLMKMVVVLACLCGLTTAAEKVSARKPNLPDGCVLYFAFDKNDYFQKEGQVRIGQTWVRDKSGHGNDGEVIGNVQSVAGRIGLGVELDGSSGYIRVKDSPSLKSNTFTLAAWVKVKELRNTSSPIIGKDAWPDGEDQGYTLRFDSKQWIPDCNIGAHGHGWMAAIGEGEKPIVAGIWAHLAATFDSHHRLTLYVNGKLASTITTTPMVNSSCDLLIGNRPFCFSDHLFCGTIDEVLIANKAMSAQQILRLVQGGVSKIETSNVQN